MNNLMPKKEENTIYAGDVMTISSDSSKSKSKSRGETPLTKKESIDKRASKNHSPIGTTSDMITSPKFNKTES